MGVKSTKFEHMFDDLKIVLLKSMIFMIYYSSSHLKTFNLMQTY